MLNSDHSEIQIANIENTKQFDFNVYSCGRDILLPPGHTWGPLIRDHYVIQYCTRGCGTVIVNDNPFRVNSGECFICFPGAVLVEKADEKDPWGLSWIILKGIRMNYYLKMLDITEKSPVISSCKDNHILEYMNQIIDSFNQKDQGTVFRHLSNLYAIFSEIFILKKKSYIPLAQTQNEYVSQAIQYIDNNYYNKIKISDIAEHLGINRSYFFSIFKKYMHLSPQDYLIQFRVKKACEFLSNPYATISNVAYSVGYDPLILSRIFKHIIGISPTEYKQRMQNTQPDATK